MKPLRTLGADHQAIHMGRKGIGIELCDEYWRCAVGYCEMAEREAHAPTLFDCAEVGK